jgi:hypothetical protein
MRRRYDTCFLKWYSESMWLRLFRHLKHELTSLLEFVRGVAKEDECAPLFEKYSLCLTV